VESPDLTADQFGWPELAATVSNVYENLPARREHAVVLTENFGAAAALERYAGRELSVHSGYRGYGDWGHPPETATTVVIVAPAKKTEPPTWAVRACGGGVRLVATTANDHGVRTRNRADGCGCAPA